MALARTSRLRRGAAGVAGFAACLPLLIAGAIVTAHPLPFLLALAAAAAVGVSVYVRRLRRYAIVAAAALFVILVSPLADSTRVETEAELGAARFGFPFGFVEAQLTATPPLPYTLTWNPWEDASRLRVGPFVASVALVVAPALLLAAAGASDTASRAVLRLTERIRAPKGS